MTAAQFNQLSNVSGPDGIALAAYSAVIDLTAAPAKYVIFPAIARRFRPIAFSWELETVGGTRSVAPTLSLGGNDPNYNDSFASQVGNAGLLTQAAHTGGIPVTQILPNPIIDLTVSGFKLNITAAMTGAAPVCTARLLMMYMLIPV
jgi:hypothetical protein